MGFHRCEYISREEAEAKGLKYAKYTSSSGDTIINFQSGRSWQFPDMAALYIELGWVPPKEFIEDLQSGEILDSTRMQTKSMTRRVGYLSPEKDPLPLERNPMVPEGLEDKLADIISKASDFGARRKQYRGGGPRR